MVAKVSSLEEGTVLVSAPELECWNGRRAEIRD